MPSVLHRLVDWAQTAPDSPAQRFKVNGEWRTISAREYRDRVYHLALFLESRGFQPGEASAILSYNSPEWVHVDLAAMLAGMLSAGLYPNSSPKDIQYILNHTGATLLSVQNKDYFKKITGGEKGEYSVPERIKLILVFDGDTSISPKAVSYETALAEGRKIAAERKDAAQLGKLLSKIDPKAGAFLIYTSGTTGNPKGALLSHDNLTYTSDIVSRYWKLPSARGTMFSFLPLCHIAEKLQSVGVGITQRYTVSFCTKFDNVATELVEVQPTLLLCVPRLWEKMMEGVQNKLKRGKGAKKQLALWALSVGERVAAARYSGQTPSPVDLLQLKLADKLVIGKIREALGLAKAEVLASGAAPLGPHVSKWFRSIGLEILEDFGQTESSGVICMTEAGVESAGTVGRPVPGLDFKLAEDGEILTRGRHVFVGYFKDDDSTSATLAGGWLHTGDLGVLNEKGLVQIRGRKKEVLKTSGGKMIAPVPIEEKLKAAELISQVCIVGDGRKYISALITLSESALAEFKGRGGKSDGLVVTDSETLSQVKGELDQLNRSLAQFEQLKKFTVLSREFSIEDGEMTPTLKMKRNVIESRFKDIIDRMYQGAAD